MKNEELKPCPFCGGRALGPTDAWPHMITCEKCGAGVKGFKYAEEGEQEAVEKWNRRVAEDVLPARPDAPRVMTLEEAANAECVFYDWRTRGVRPAKLIRVPYKTGTYRVQLFGDIDEWVHADEYGEYWLCWTAMPAEEQRAEFMDEENRRKWLRG